MSASTPINMSSDSTLLAFKAGRAFRRGNSNFVDSSSTKGAIILTNGEDGLLHFVWKNRETNQVEEDLILFPSDATFVKISPTSRNYVLKFSSSDQRHFFWMQDASSARDDEFVNNLNGLLENPEYILSWNTVPTAMQASSSTPEASGSAQTSTTGPPTEQVASLEALLTSIAAQNASTEPSELSLGDILTPANLDPLFTGHPELILSLFPHLPPDLPMPPSAEVLQRVIASPQFRAAVVNFDQALRTGLLGGLVRSLGLPEEAGAGIGPFLKAIREQANREGARGSDSMETD